MKEISKKRILFALAPLLVLNCLLVLDIFVFKNMAWSQNEKYEYDKDEKIYTSQKSQQVSYNGEPLFTYEGADANCWDMEREWQIQECLAKHKYGGQGTLVMEGNLVVNEAQALYLNGYDSSGMNWMMTTTTEPWGNAMGTKQGTGIDTYYGNNMVVEGNVKTGKVKFEAASSSLSYEKNQSSMVADGLACEVETLDFANFNKKTGKARGLKVVDTGICGMCDGYCSVGKVGDGYRFSVVGGLEVKEITKVNKTIRICGDVDECEEACCRIAEYLEDDTYDNFVAADCTSSGFCDTLAPEPDNCYAHDYGAKSSCTFCYPQPYIDQPTQERRPITDAYEKRSNVNEWFAK